MLQLISAIHDKDELLDSQEDFLIKENKKHVKVKNAYAQEVEKCEKLTNELSTCHETIDNLRNENANLLAKVDSHICNVSIPRNNNDDLLARIEKLNEVIGAIHEKDELLDSQEDFLIKENKKHVKVKNAYAQEVEKCENLNKELSICHD